MLYIGAGVPGLGGTGSGGGVGTGEGVGTGMLGYGLGTGMLGYGFGEGPTSTGWLAGGEGGSERTTAWVNSLTRANAIQAVKSFITRHLLVMIE